MGKGAGEVTQWLRALAVPAEDLGSGSSIHMVAQHTHDTHECIRKTHTFKEQTDQPKCPSSEEWIRKMWYIYTMEYYTRKKIMTS